jgi:hypothetical protein
MQIAEPYFECAQRLEAAFGVPGKTTVWYLMSESHALRVAAHDRYGEKVVTDTKLAMSHPDCKAHNPGACNADSMHDSLRHSIGQLVTFSLADYHIYTRSSGFGRLGAWLSGSWANLYSIDGRVCDPAHPDSPEQSAFEWAGV